MKKTINTIIYILAGITILLFLFYLFTPKDIAQQISKNKNNILCKLPIKIEGKSLEPVINRGDIIIFNKCFDLKDLKKNTPIVFRQNSLNTVCLIEKIENDLIYLYQPNKMDQKFEPITAQDILAIYYEQENPTSPIKKELNKVEFQNALILIPKNWEVVSQKEDSIIIQNINEKDFKTYFQVYIEELDKEWLEYITEFKTKTKKLAPEIVFTNEEISNINNNDIYIISSQIQQQDKDFVVKFALLKKDKKVYIFAFNSLKMLEENNYYIFQDVLDNLYFK